MVPDFLVKSQTPPNPAHMEPPWLPPLTGSPPPLSTMLRAPPQSSPGLHSCHQTIHVLIHLFTDAKARPQAGSSPVLGVNLVHTRHSVNIDWVNQ